MRALEPEVVDAVWAVVEPLLPPPSSSHPLGCHRHRASDRLCFWGLLIRLVTGASWVDVEAILGHQVSDTTLRARRDEWIAADVFDQIKELAVARFDEVVGLDTTNIALDASMQKAPYGGEGTGPNPCDRAKLGWKWSVVSDSHGIPLAWAIDAANRNDVVLLEPTLDALADVGRLDGVGRLHLDRAYDSGAVRQRLLDRNIADFDIQLRGTRVPGVKRQPLNLGRRWVVEATNTWWSNYGQLRRSTDRKVIHRHAALCFATATLIIGRLLRLDTAAAT
jgi:transposase